MNSWRRWTQGHSKMTEVNQMNKNMRAHRKKLFNNQTSFFNLAHVPNLIAAITNDGLKETFCGAI